MAAVLIAGCVIVSVTVAAGELVRATIVRMLTPRGAPGPHRAPVTPLRPEPRHDERAA